MNYLAPSILSADFANLKRDIDLVKKAGVKYLHIDVMDGLFVPSISFGMPVIKSIKAVSDLIFDVHLMIVDPERYLEDFKNAGADIISIHIEATKNVSETLNRIKEMGLKACLVVNPETDIETTRPYLSLCDMVLIMSVHPGFGGQKYIESSTDKIKKLALMRKEEGLDFDIEIDGGIKLDNVKTVLDAGANIIVAGSAVFNGDIIDNINRFNAFL